MKKYNYRNNYKQVLSFNEVDKDGRKFKRTIPAGVAFSTTTNLKDLYKNLEEVKLDDGGNPETDLSDVKTKIQALTKQVEDLKAEALKKDGELKGGVEKIQALTKQVEDLKAEALKKDGELKALSDEIAEFKKKAK